jgi:hypothetical protein
LQLGTDTLQRISGWTVFARFGTVALFVVMSIAGFVAIIVWAVRRKKTGDGRLWMRLWPLVASATLFAYQVVFGMGGNLLNELGVVSPISVGLLFLSLLYPAAVLAGTASLFTVKSRAPKNLPWWFAAAFAAVHLVIVWALAGYGLLGLRTWT